MLERQEWLNLNGQWDYAVRANTAVDLAGQLPPAQFDGTIRVPFAIETVASGLARELTPDQTLYYRRRIELPAEWSGRRVVLNFEAVDHECVVWVDGKIAGRHQGGYLPFSVELPADVLNCQVVVAVRDPSDSGGQPYGKQALNPKTIWYTATSGIWGTVWAEPLPSNAITRITATSWPGRDGVDLLVQAEESGQCEVSVFGPGGQVYTCTVTCGVSSPLAMPHARIWSPDNPYLYRVRASLGPDRVTSWLAVRTVGLGPIPGANVDERDAVLLNGRPILLNTPLDQGYWPESGMTPPSDDALIFDLRQLKDMGFNGVRKHIKVESRRFYHHADRLGMIVMQDLVNGGRPRVTIGQSRLVMALGLHLGDTSRGALASAGRTDDANRRRFEADLLATIEHLAPHASVLVWVLFNEAWGQYHTDRLEGMIRQADPSRLVDAASGWYDQGGGDFRSRHRYTLALQRPPQRDRRPYLISEFGGLNLPVEGHRWPGSEQFGYRFHSTATAYGQALATLYRNQLIPLVHEGLRGCVYTQVSDVERETNGLFTYDRRPKLDPELLRELNAELNQAFQRLGLW